MEAKAIIGKEGAVTHIIWGRDRLCVLVAWKMSVFCLCSDVNMECSYFCLDFHCGHCSLEEY